MLIFTACAAAFLGFIALSLAMSRHFRNVFAAAEPAFRQRLALRLAGWLLLAVTAVLCIAVWGLSVGIVALFGVLTMSAFAVALMLTYAPTMLVRTGAVFGLIGGCALVLAVFA